MSRLSRNEARFRVQTLNQVTYTVVQCDVNICIWIAISLSPRKVAALHYRCCRRWRGSET